MLISPPFLPPFPDSTNTPSLANTPDPVMDAVDAFEMRSGIYPIAFDGRWHCGMHLETGYQATEVRAIADGEVVAYRACQKAINDGQTDDQSGAPLLNSNTGFVLLKHTTETGEGRSITFYSLYMHLLDFDNITGLMGNLPPLGSAPHVIPEWLRMPTDNVVSGAGKKVYRKDVIGYLGKCHGNHHLHFEIFMLPSDFEDYFGKTQLDNKQPATPTGTDYWGHSHYIVPTGQTFLAQPTGANAQNKLNDIGFPPLQSAQNETTLHVETYFHNGGKYTHVWAVDAKGKRTRLTEEEPRPEKDYEYDLYKRATKLYPACPSDGYELLRFGRILSSPATIPAGPGRTTWMRMTFAAGQEGYLDINDEAIVKLSDADFPALEGWRKITEGNTPFCEQGLCDINVLKKMVGDADVPPEPEGAGDFWRELGIRSTEMSRYLSDINNGHVRKQLRGFVCEAPSEWDAARLELRYGKLKEEGEFFYDKEAAYNRFIGFVKKFCFWDKTGLPAGKLWFFHPLQFIRYFRRCGWLAAPEMAQLFPKKILHLKLTQFHPSTTTWNEAFSRTEKWLISINKATRKYGVSLTQQRLLHLFAHLIPETGNLRYVKEIDGEQRDYSPYYGRGLIQLTHIGNYRDYGSFRKFQGNNIPTKYTALGWDPDEIIAKDNSGQHNYENCIDSACFYVVKRSNMLKHMDSGTSQDNAIIVSKDVNGNVDIENLNGLDARLQSVIYLRHRLLDEIPEHNSISISFVWRRNSQKEPIYDAQGNIVMIGQPPKPKKKFYRVLHTINVSIDAQKP